MSHLILLRADEHFSFSPYLSSPLQIPLKHAQKQQLTSEGWSEGDKKENLSPLSTASSMITQIRGREKLALH